MYSIRAVLCVVFRLEKQVVKLWQRDRASSAILKGWVTLKLSFRLKGYVSRQYLWTVRWGNGYTTTLQLEVFTQRNFVAHFIRLKWNFIQKKQKKRFLSHLFGDLGVTYTHSTCSSLESPWSTSYSSQFNFLRYLLRLRRYKQKSVEVGVFQREWVTLSANFRRKGASPTNHCCCQKTRVIVLSCGIKISAVHCFILSQSTPVTDRQTDRITIANTALA